MVTAMTITTVRDQYRTDGVVFLPQALDPDELALCEAAYEWSLANPGPGASSLGAGEPGRFLQDLNNRDARNASRNATSGPSSSERSTRSCAARLAEPWYGPDSAAMAAR